MRIPKRLAISLGIGITAIVLTLAIDRWLYLQQFASGQPLSPDATIIREQDGKLVNGKELTKLGESSRNSRSNPDNSLQLIYEKPGKVVTVLYYRQDFHDETVAATVTNNSTSQITITELMIGGERPCYYEPDCWIESLRRPVILTVPEGVKTLVYPTYNGTVVLNPNDTLSAYVEGDFRLQKYDVGVCYSYDVRDPTTHYCGRFMTTQPLN